MLHNEPNLNTSESDSGVTPHRLQRASITSKTSNCTTSKKPRRPDQAAPPPPIERSWLPDYDRMFAEMFHKFCNGWAAVGSALFKLHFMHFILFPVGIYHLMKVWLAGFVGIPDQIERTSTATWFDRYVKLTPFDGEEGVERSGLWWVPQTDLAISAKRGLSQRGLTHFQMFTKIMLFFPQLMSGSFWRCLQFKMNFGAFKPTKGDNHNTYLSIVNTSLLQFYDPAQQAFVYWDCTLLADYNNCQRKFSTVKVYCDHDEGEVTHMVLSIAADPHHNIEAVDIVVTDPDEISVIVTQVGAFMTHPQVHWWANGVTEIEQWKLSGISSIWTNFLNMLAAFQSLFFYHAPFNNDTELIGRNLLGGTPANREIPECVLEWSVAHAMAKEARAKIKAHFERERRPLKEQELNCLMSATMLHSADHHYLNKYAAMNGISQILKSDFRVMRICIVGGYRWLGTKFLCKQYLDDPVCKILYNVASKHDPEFADGLLTIGIAI